MSTEVSEMITVVIDGFEVTVPKGTLVIRAAVLIQAVGMCMDARFLTDPAS